VKIPALASPPTAWYPPPRTKAAGAGVIVSAPARHMELLVVLPPLNVAQPGHAVDVGIQSATHSLTLPTMSNAPHAETQPVRAPVATAVAAAETLQSVVPLSVPGAGVPAAACHS